MNLNNENEVRDSFFAIQKTSVLSLKIYDTNFAMRGSVKNMVFHHFNVWNIINKVKNAVSFWPGISMCNPMVKSEIRE